jgi:hypothetical protein
MREVPGSNIGPETGYPDWGSLWFSWVPPGECWDSTLKLDHNRFLPNPFQSGIHFIECYIALVTEKVSLNKLQIE